ncbi:hypothetical protein GUITHDRAFT_111187 [Guillardia theta CCMP2712]|uniref:FAS1 domain-containing protein n=2 Tax=Guillardia theta TaxID=55529 RepID=L1J3F2_GUITC|nr:hypothetical protein GUITHDRAFT_111187 [Guillardia theta CCMP2712]EKX42817.1 hypothetical protein GUITHDRAFT_111187 [Guillardia theta CCMP2712]|mmetsp:Transcript_35592/g.111343  ORF Transcript_35592/g.111343 Transcript_35592/m.111343 type:complete len:194 (+) Transcript_35592:141-722(+)|eukprot:XP_005829797.1 hypothetical protein GUITHDRAFT_111187 [Guillardia theta CCMP2712]
MLSAMAGQEMLAIFLGWNAIPVLVAVSILCVLLCACMSKGAKETVRDILQRDPDTTLFFSYYEELKQGAWDKPSLSKHHATRSLVVFAPVNSALQSNVGQRLLMSLNEQEWRKYLLSHVALSQVLDPASLEKLGRDSAVTTVTGIGYPLSTLFSKYTDGTDRVLAARRASNGWVYKVPALLPAEDLFARKTDD